MPVAGDALRKRAAAVVRNCGVIVIRVKIAPPPQNAALLSAPAYRLVRWRAAAQNPQPGVVLSNCSDMRRF